MISTIEIDFIQEIKKAGIEPPENIVVDGQFHILLLLRQIYIEVHHSNLQKSLKMGNLFHGKSSLCIGEYGNIKPNLFCPGAIFLGK